MELWKIEETGEVNEDAIRSMKAWKVWLNTMCDEAFDDMDYLTQEIPLYSLMCDMRAENDQLRNEIQDIRNEQIDQSGTQFLELRKVADIAGILVRNDYCEMGDFLLKRGWHRDPHHWWFHDEHAPNAQESLTAERAVLKELEIAVNAAQKPGG